MSTVITPDTYLEGKPVYGLQGLLLAYRQSAEHVTENNYPEGVDQLIPVTKDFQAVAGIVAASRRWGHSHISTETPIDPSSKTDSLQAQVKAGKVHAFSLNHSLAH